MRKSDFVYVVWDHRVKPPLPWGHFSTNKKLHKAVRGWRLGNDWALSMYEVDYRLKNIPPRYLSDENVKDDSKG